MTRKRVVVVGLTVYMLLMVSLISAIFALNKATMLNTEINRTNGELIHRVDTLLDQSKRSLKVTEESKVKEAETYAKLVAERAEHLKDLKGCTTQIVRVRHDLEKATAPYKGR